MENALLNVAQIFTMEINKLEAKLAGSGATIDLSIKGPGRWVSEKTVTVDLMCTFFDGTTHQTVKGASLGAVMDEVYRRAGFAGREAIALDRVEASLKALPSPDQD